MALVDLAIFLLTLVVNLGVVGACRLPLGGGLSRGTLLQHPVEGKLSVQARLFLFHLQASDFVHFTDVRCVQHWNTVKRLGPVPGGPVLGRPQGWSPEFLSSI